MAYDIEVIELDPQPVLVIEDEVAPAEIGAALARIFPTVHRYVTEQGAEMAGMPFLRYLAMGEKFAIDAGIPTTTALPGRNEIKSKTLPGGRAATALHLGEYQGVGAAWDAVFAWCREQNIAAGLGGWDVYENDPTGVSDPGELRTRIYLPLPD